jgi:fibronectin-binding autotransporter adhesin
MLAVAFPGQRAPVLRRLVLCGGVSMLAIAGLLAQSVPVQAAGCNGPVQIVSTTISGPVVPTGGGILVTGTGAIVGNSVVNGVNNSNCIGTLSNSGSISGLMGIANTGTIATLTNGGTLSGAITAVVSAGTIGTISNNGIIIGYHAIQNSGTIDLLRNTGTITSSSNTSAVVNHGTIGTLTNSGTIGGNIGIANDGSIGTLSNSKLISSTYNGIFNAGTIGTLTNSGKITGGQVAISNTGGRIGTLGNSSLLQGTRTGLYNTGAVGALTNSGTIIGQTNGIYIGTGATLGTLTNNGTIAGASNAGLVNEGNIRQINNVLWIRGNSGLLNNGTIGNLTNSGLIVGDGSSGLVNSGRIDSLANNDVISGASTGIANSGSLGILTNLGTISGGLYGLNSTGAITQLVNGGVIQGSKTGLINGGTIGTLTNSGTISGTPFAVVNSGSIGSLNNGGIISATGTSAIANAGQIGTLTNSGTISGVVAIGGAGTIAVIVNTGVINGASYAINATGATAPRLANTGSIIGNIAVQGASLTIVGGSGTNFGSFTGGTISAPAASLLFASGNNLVADDIDVGSGNITVNPGAYVALAGSPIITATGGLANNGTLDISPTNGGVIVARLSGNGAVLLGTQTLTVQPGGEIFSGVISGTGGLTLATGALGDNPGNLTLAGVNNFAGTVSIAEGTSLVLAGSGSVASSALVNDLGAFDISATSAGASIMRLSGSGSLVLGNQFLTITNANDLFSGAISGAGGLAVIAGSETLTGTSAYTGGTSISGGGVVSVDSDAALGAASGGVTLNSGTLHFLSDVASNRPITLGPGGGTLSASSANITLAGNISGAGALLVTGGTTTLSGANSFTGGLTVTSASLAVTSDAALGAPTGLLILDNATLQTLASFTSRRPITIASGGGIIDSNSYDLTLGGPLNVQGALTKIGSGSLSLTGTTAANGSVAFNDGTVFQNGTLTAPGLSVGAGGTLGGTGIINAPTTIYGVLRPGNSPGTLTFSQSVTQAAGSTLALEIDGVGSANGAGNFSRVVVAGADNSYTAGGTIAPILRGLAGDASNSYSPPIGSRFTVVTAEGGVVANFAAIAEPSAGLLPNTQFDAIYGANNVQLVVTPISFGLLGQTPNQIGVANALQSLRPAAGSIGNPALANVFATLFSQPAASYPGMLNHLGAPIYGDALLNGMQRDAEFGDAINQQLALRRGILPHPKPDDATVSDNGVTLWVTGLAGNSHMAATGNTGFSSSGAGAVAGADRESSDGRSRAGLATGFTGSTVTSPATGGSSDQQAVRLVAYASHSMGRFFIDGQGGMTLQTDKFRRALGVFGGTAMNDTLTEGYHGEVEYGERYRAFRSIMHLVVGMRMETLHRGGTAENDALLSLHLAKQDLTSIRSKVGLESERVFVIGEFHVATNWRLFWMHESGDATTQAIANFNNFASTPFTVVSAKAGRDATVGNLALSANLAENLNAYAGYGFDLRQSYNGQSANLGIRYGF